MISNSYVTVCTGICMYMTVTDIYIYIHTYIHTYIVTTNDLSFAEHTMKKTTPTSSRTVKRKATESSLSSDLHLF